MNVPANLKYTKDHEWLKVDGEHAYVGITDFAQHELGDIVFIEVETVGEVQAHDEKVFRFPIDGAAVEGRVLELAEQAGVETPGNFLVDREVGRRGFGVQNRLSACGEGAHHVCGAVQVLGPDRRVGSLHVSPRQTGIHVGGDFGRVRLVIIQVFAAHPDGPVQLGSECLVGPDKEEVGIAVADLAENIERVAKGLGANGAGEDNPFRAGVVVVPVRIAENARLTVNSCSMRSNKAERLGFRAKPAGL